MELPSLLPDGVAEDVAVALLRHLEWQQESFSVVFLFADIGPISALIDWLARNAALRGSPVQRIDATDTFVGDAEAWLDGLLALWRQQPLAPGSHWLLLHRHPADGRWTRARLRLLARVNERRYLLEQHVKRPLVIVLPLRFRDAARRIAPDLWHVRAFSQELAAPKAALKGSIARVPNPAPPQSSETMAMAPSAAYSTWVRVWQGADPGAIYLPLAQAAVSELLNSGRPGDAMEVALQAQAEGRRRLSLPDTASRERVQRDLSLVLDELGRVARAQGDWAQADKAYRESLEISRDLVERLGGTPESLRDMSVSLDKLGDVASAQGDWAQADKAYREGLEINRGLVERLGGTPESLNDLAISFLNLGVIERAQQRPAEARGYFDQGLAAAEAALQQSPLSKDIHDAVDHARAQLPVLPALAELAELANPAAPPPVTT